MWYKYLIAALSIYTLFNALLHDFFIVRSHKQGYDRNLLRLLMDGHILIVSGVLYLVSFLIFKDHPQPAMYMNLIASSSLIIYCLMIFPFLKSFVTLVLNLAMLAITLYQLV